MTRMVLTLMGSALLATGIGLVPAGSLEADVLLIEEVRQSERMELPANGLTQAEVRAAYGEPASTQGPVGDPPITRWDYSDFSVFFEHDKVVHSVVHRPGAD